MWNNKYPPDGEFKWFELFSIFDKVIPKKYTYYGNTVDFLLSNETNKYYKNKCNFLGANVDYKNKRIELYLVSDPEDPVGGDGFVDFNFTNDEQWQNNVIDEVGSFEDNVRKIVAKETLSKTKIGIPNIVNKITGHMGGRRKTRKNKKSRKSVKSRKIKGVV